MKVSIISKERAGCKRIAFEYTLRAALPQAQQ